MGKGNGQTDRVSALTMAAAGLETELRRYVELARAAVRVPLTSEKNLDRAARAIADAAESERRVLEQVSALGQAVAEAREAQQSSTAALNAHVETVGTRREELGALLGRFAALGELAHTMNEAMQKLTAYKANPYERDAASEQEMQAALAEMATAMTTAATRAQELASEATEKDFEEIARQAEGLRQQLLATKNRLSLLRG
jgi:hypothetical protein